MKIKFSIINSTKGKEWLVQPGRRIVVQPTVTDRSLEAEEQPGSAWGAAPRPEQAALPQDGQFRTS